MGNTLRAAACLRGGSIYRNPVGGKKIPGEVSVNVNPIHHGDGKARDGTHVIAGNFQKSQFRQALTYACDDAQICVVYVLVSECFK